MPYDVAIRRVPDRARFEIRGEPAAAIAGLVAAGLAPPAERNARVVDARGVAVAWLGPRRWLVTAAIELEPSLHEALERGFGTVALADVARVSDMYTAFDVAGPDACHVLSQGTSLDLDSSVLHPGSSTATEMWRIGVLLETSNDGPNRFIIIVDRSLADYLEQWLLTAAGEPQRQDGLIHGIRGTSREGS